MALMTFPLNDIDYEAKDLEAYFSTRSSGLIETEDFNITVDGTSTTATVGAGRAWIKNTTYAGKLFLLDEPVTLDFSTPPQVGTTYQYIAIKFSAIKNATEVIIKSGTEYEVPVQNSNEYELFLYKITRKSTDIVITQELIEDLRGNPTYCPYMVDTASPVDDTLTKQGYAADAKAAGDRFTTYDEKFTNFKNVEKVVLPLSDTVKVYSGDGTVEATTPYILKNGNTVQIVGAISPKSSSNKFGSNAGDIIATIPSGFRPIYSCIQKCQGSLYDSWTIRISPDGTVRAERYNNGTEFITPTTTVWMPFSVTYITEQS